MAIYQIFFAVFALSIPIAAFTVGGRLLWCIVRSLQTKQFKIAAFAVLALASLAGLFVALGLVWFGYAVAHSKKDIWDDLLLVVITGLPFYGVSYGLWRLAGYFQATIRSHVTEQFAPAERPQAGAR
jgi:hypothetical protein